MAPERIDPVSAGEYDIRSDVWSLGISMIELATGKFPYNIWRSPFEQIKQVSSFNHSYKQRTAIKFLPQVVVDPPPRLEPGKFSPEFEDFIAKCLQKVYKLRPNYDQLIAHEFIAFHLEKNSDISGFVGQILDLLEAQQPSQ